jgi:7,8-dihydropterin-6-yl-methyl-4-(beta-D-ribofuranosyl)aminobenzene 5'-phosphate synthase
MGMSKLGRREFLRSSVAFAASAGAFSCVEVATAAPIEVPTIDRLAVRVLVDQQHDQFLRGSTVKGPRAGTQHRRPKRAAQ